MDVRFCEGRNHRREAQMRAGVLAIVVLARSSVARVRRMLFPLDKDLHGCRPLGPWPVDLSAKSRYVKLKGNALSSELVEASDIPSLTCTQEARFKPTVKLFIDFVSSVTIEFQKQAAGEIRRRHYLGYS
jgi:hypothetical protein